LRDARAWWVQTIMKGGKDILAVRHYNHTGFLVNLPVDSSMEITVEDVVQILDRGGTHHTLGMRGYYLAIPLTLRLIGPPWLLAGTLLLIGTLY